jgi:hypothetical protein
MFICEPTAREPKVGTKALVQHGTQVFFGSVFCSVSVKSSDRSVCVATTIPREARTPGSAFNFLLLSDRALNFAMRMCISAIAPTVPKNPDRALLSTILSHALRRGFFLARLTNANRVRVGSKHPCFVYGLLGVQLMVRGAAGIFLPD